MKFRSLRVSNLRAVRTFEVDDLKDFIVVAGPNGCGKSCVFDAIRLLKSVYGGYQADEHMQWFAEFAINLQDRSALKTMFRDPAQPIQIAAGIEFSSDEKAFMKHSASELVWPIAWERATGQRMDYWTFNRMAIATQLAQHREVLEHLVAQITSELVSALDATDEHELAVAITPEGDLSIETCVPAEVSFQAYEPQNLGIIEYHSASRAYPRQPLGGINLDARAFEEQRRQQRLYNWQAKYQNIKTELAAAYLRSLITAQSGEAAETGEDLNETLKELFHTFFPDKEYEGVRPLSRGNLEFPVRLPDGARHDIDDLSSGEKEILYGYLRLKNSIPRGSVILLDEPELHLNPSLLQGFADFYYRHLGVAQNNQLWLVTHSDTLLRQAIGNSNYRVYHMVAATSSTGNQASEVLLNDDVERVVVDLVGDLAAYQPHAKLVILEGAGEDGFDEMFIRRLFPNFAKRVNLVSAGSKRRVRNLYAALNEAVSKAGIANRFFAIVDKDTEPYVAPEAHAQEFTWDVYHVENFLLVPAAIRDACASLMGGEIFSSDQDVMDALKAEASQLVESLTLERVQADINEEMIRAIEIKGPPDTHDVADSIRPSIEASARRVSEVSSSYTTEELTQRAERARGELVKALEGQEWLAAFPGRRILRLFVNTHLDGVAYEPFRNVVLDKLAMAEYRPDSMKRVLDTILAA
jgi:AAA domain, putative AbiEii toxin, Type IV TA system